MILYMEHKLLLIKRLDFNDYSVTFRTHRKLKQLPLVQPGFSHPTQQLLLVSYLVLCESN